MTDYLAEGISAVLSQVFSDGEHPVAYWSKANRGAQTSYQATVGECFAAVQGIKPIRERFHINHRPFSTEMAPKS